MVFAYFSAFLITNSRYVFVIDPSYYPIFICPFITLIFLIYFTIFIDLSIIAAAFAVLFQLITLNAS